ncbi:MAG: EamA family transporter [Clostridiaceae bacterium]|nr:EamA family transporter [Clostridiaceae bacterium]
MWLVLSLIALLMWSGSDLFSKLGCQNKSEKTAPLKMLIAIGLMMGLHAFYEIFIKGIAFSIEVIWIYFPVSILYIVSMAIGYFGLRYIELSISSPICNTSGALVVLFYMIRGFMPDAIILIGVFFTFIGILGLGIAEYIEDEQARIKRQEAANIKYHKSIIAILLPILYSLIDALGTYADSLVFKLTSLDEAQANIAYELTFFIVGLIVFVYLLIHHKFKITKTDRSKMLASVFETAGQFAYIYAIADNPISAAPIISCYSVLTVIWSRIILKEKLSWKHYVGIITAFIGIVILAVFDNE